MNFNYSEKTHALQNRLQEFMQENIYPNEQRFHDEINSGDRWQPSELMEKLKTKARQSDLWNLFRRETPFRSGRYFPA